MAEQREALIVYDGLPISSGGAHRIRGGDPAAVWRRLRDFIDTCTELTAPLDTSVVLYQQGDPPAQFEHVLASANKTFGNPARNQTSWGVGQVQDVFVYGWTVEPERVAGAVEWMLSQPSLPLTDAGQPLLVVVTARFKLRDPSTGLVLPYQGPEHYPRGDWVYGATPIGLSNLHARLSQQSTCGLVMSLPFEDVSQELRDFVALLQDRLPFRLSAKHWERWQLNRAGIAYYARKASVLT